MHHLYCRGQAGTLSGFSPVLSSLLIARGADTPEKAHAFLHPSEGDLSDPFLLSGMKEATALVHETLAARAPVFIFGDYDCDGVCASAILYEALTDLGATPQVYIPSRHDEGYGLNENAVRKIAVNGGLLITVDCGVTAVREVSVAKTLGMRVIVTDHHTLPEDLPPADVLLHPSLGDAPCKNLCGAGLAYKFATALMGKQVLPSLELAGLATIADMVPLLSENRTLAALGLRQMQQSRRVGLNALLRVAGINDGEAISGTQAAFQLAPRINACGRMRSADPAFELLTTQSPARAEALAAEADAFNAQRKNIEQHILEEAEAQVRALDLCQDRAIVVVGDRWESGVVGLAAGRLAERYGYPTVVLSRQDGVCVGSARSASGVDLYQALHDCGDIFVRFGGHKQAAGMTIESQNLDLLRARLSENVRAQLDGRIPMPETAYDSVLPLSDLTLPLVEEISRLEPFGMANPAPVFLLEDADVLAARAVGAGGAHLKLTLSQNGALRDGIAFRMGERAASLSGLCDLLITPTANTFRGHTSAEFRVEAIGRAHTRFPKDENGESKAILQEFIAFWRNKNDCAIAQEVSLPAQLPLQGTLLLCRTADTAAALSARFPRLDVLSGNAPDPRAYSAVWHCHALDYRGAYRQIYLCDGALCPQEIAQLQALYPKAQIFAMQQSEALKSRLAALRFNVDELRALYRDLRAGVRPDLSLPRVQAMAAVLAALELTTPELQLLPMRKCDPAAHPLYQLIQGSEI